VDLEDLMEDIHVYCELEQDTHLDFWKVSTHTHTHTQKKACVHVQPFADHVGYDHCVCG